MPTKCRSLTIVGGGPAGLLTAAHAASAGLEVRLYEEHTVFGRPRHCTGVVSESTAFLLPKEAVRVLSKYREMTVLTPAGEIELVFGEAVVTIDRVLLEEVLAEVAASEGAEIVTGMRAFPRPREGECVVAAEGARAEIALEAGLCGRRTYLVGAQYIIRSGDGPDHPVVVALPSVSKEYFGWVVPAGDREYVLGLADDPRLGSVTAKALELRNLFTRLWGDHEIVKRFGGLIPVCRTCTPARGPYFGIGDSVCMVKQLSGGGLFAIARAAPLLARAVAEGADYVALIAPIMRTLHRSWALTKVVRALGGYWSIASLLAKAGLRRLSFGRYDLIHEGIMKTLTRNLRPR